jgi:hypothetical protein
MRLGLPSVGLVLLALAAPCSSAAQIVQGQVRDAASQAPVQGALVVLLDTGGRQVGGSLTDEGGSFRMRAPAPGRYALRAERIGFETVTSDPFELSEGPAVRMDLEAAAKAVALEGIQVEGERRCVVHPEEGEALAQVWDEARKALRNQEWTDETGLVRFRLTHYERELDPQTRVVLSQSRRSVGWTGRNPIRSLPVEDLLENGFIRKEDDGGYTFLGPDAAVLLSDAFLATHCFRLEADEADPGLIGLGFEPVHRRKAADITGTLWLGRQDAKLRFLTFGYTSSPWPEASGVANGRVEFEELPGGAWVIRRWWIRMPRMVQSVDMAFRGLTRLRVAAIVEAGGAATQVDESRAVAAGGERTDPPDADVPSGASRLDTICLEEDRVGGSSAVAGVVRGTRDGSPVTGATVTLEWATYRVVDGREVRGDVRTVRVTTDTRGGYTACGIPPGVLLTARATLDGAAGGSRRVEVPREEVVQVDLLVPRGDPRW